VTIAPPSSPDAPTHPRFWYAVLTVFVASFFLLGIGTLLAASVREHAQV
jgi:capsule polysaccharide export protein KpsE/RkpR